MISSILAAVNADTKESMPPKWITVLGLVLLFSTVINEFVSVSLSNAFILLSSSIHIVSAYIGL